MWGSILTEANTLTNFNFGFSTYKSDILLHLSQWQYWWWFWFSLIWSVYFFIIIRLMNKRTFNFNPIMNTSIRGHGKWGDFLVALIPLSWCGNILVNSNFILRMIEWQNESSLFTIRVQGKQWYWVYKFDAAAAQSIFNAPKNIGNNRWFITTPLESYCSDTYYQALNLGTQLEFKSLYYKYLSDDNLLQTALNKESLQTNSESFNYTNRLSFLQIGLKNRTKLHNSWCFKPKFMKKHYIDTNIKSIIKKDNPLNIRLSVLEVNDNLINLSSYFLKSFQLAKLYSNKSYYDFDQLDDLSNFAANIGQFNNIKPINFSRGILNKHNISIFQNSLIFNKKVDNNFELVIFNLKKYINRLKEVPFFKKKNLSIKEIKRIMNKRENVYVHLKKKYKSIAETKKLLISNLRLQKDKNNLILTKFKKLKFIYGRFNINTTSSPLNKPLLFTILFNSNSGVVEKIEDNELLWGFRQKKYKRFKKFFFNKGSSYNSKTLEPIKQTKTTSRQFKNNVVYAVGTKDKISDINYHNSIKYNRHKHELVPVNLARRLLRVKRTLVLPAHVNITLISNSYDVVHSWFIPGLGLKIDCVPGRSTHHTFYIDNIGFYYGQCAEICGRYHHHMPIRLCALPFEHFLVWWQKKGLQRLHRFSSLKNINSSKKVLVHSASGKTI